MKKALIYISAFLLIASCTSANGQQIERQSNSQPTEEIEHAAVFTIESVIDVDTMGNVIHYMDYDAFDPDNMDWCAAYDAATDRITATTDHETAVLIASGKVDIWNAEQFTLWFDESGRCTLKHDCHWLE
jgi:hypothetical protein